MNVRTGASIAATSQKEDQNQDGSGRMRARTRRGYGVQVRAPSAMPLYTPWSITESSHIVLRPSLFRQPSSRQCGDTAYETPVRVLSHRSATRKRSG